MAAASWIYRLADGRFLRGGFFEIPFNAITEGHMTFGDAEQPDPVRERFDATSPTKKRPATPVELEAALAEDQNREFETLAGLRALVMITYRYLPAAQRPATFAEFWTEVRDRYRQILANRQ